MATKRKAGVRAKGVVRGRGLRLPDVPDIPPERGHWRLWVPGALPGLNELLDAKSVVARRRGKVVTTAYNDLKASHQQRIALYARIEGLRRLPPVYVTYVFYEVTKRRDPSNVLAGGVKLIEDALVKLGVLRNDGWKDILGLAAYHVHEPGRAGVAVYFDPEGTFSRDWILELEKEHRNDEEREREARDED